MKSKTNKGFTLAEMLIVIIVFGLFITASATFLRYGIEVMVRVTDKTEALETARSMLVNIKSSSSTSHMALLADASFSDFAEWEKGTIMFYDDGGGTLKMKLKTSDAGVTPATFVEPLKFETLSDFSASFEVGANNGGLDNVVLVTLEFTDDKGQRLLQVSDEIFLGNLTEDAAKAFHPVVPLTAVDYKTEDDGAGNIDYITGIQLDGAKLVYKAFVFTPSAVIDVPTPP